jgi:hypothetical protein
MVTSLPASIGSFRDMIQAGGYDYLYEFAKRPEKIRGQSLHKHKSDVKFEYPGKDLTAKQIWGRLGDGDLSELLNYGITNPDAQREFRISILWKDETGQFWYASLRSTGSSRGLDINRVRPDNVWRGRYLFLVCK